MEKTSLKTITSELEDIWKKFDTLFAGIPVGGWSRKFGKDWVFADQPFHMGYMDRMVAESVSAGKSLPVENQVVVKSESELNKWNGDEFARRPAGQTAQQAWDYWKQSRDAVRKAVSRMSDADLAGPAWMPIFMGWATARDLLEFSLVHAVGEYTELRMRVKKKEPQPSAAAKNMRLDMMMNVMGVIMNQEAAKGKKLVVVWNFRGEGGGVWTQTIDDGKFAVQPGRAGKRDIEFKTTFNGFEKVARKMGNPMLMMITGEMRVSGMRKMGAFQKLFPM
jgi:hypothetical protein